MLRKKMINVYNERGIKYQKCMKCKASKLNYFSTFIGITLCYYLKRLGHVSMQIDRQGTDKKTWLRISSCYWCD